MRLKLLSDVSAITSGNEFQVRLPVPGPTFDRFQLRWGATADPGLTGFANLALVVDGNVVQEFASADVLNEMNKFYQRGAITGSGTVADPYKLNWWMRRKEVNSFLALGEVAAERVTSLRTGGVKSAWLRGTITGAGAFCTAYSEESPVLVPEPSAESLVTRIKRFSYNMGAGVNEILQDIPRTAVGLIAIHIKASDVTAINAFREAGYNVIDSVSKNALQGFQVDDDRTPVAGYTVVDFCQNGNLNEALLIHPQRDLRVNVTKTAGALTDVYVEYLDKLGSGL